MKESIKISNPIFYLIVALCAMIIMANSIETLIKAKDTELFNIWVTSLNSSIVDSIGHSSEGLYSTYISMCLGTFLIRIVTPMGLAINTYFAFKKLGVNKLFVSVWSILLIGMFLLTFIGETLFSILFILSSICYVALLLIILYLGKNISTEKNILNYKKA